MTHALTDTLIAAHAEADQPGASLRALDAALAQSPGHILFTVLISHPGLLQNERFYSNKPAEYPVGGSKPITDSPWMRRVIREGLPYIGRTREDIRDVFFDYELIWSLGCESVLNYPVRWRGQTVARSTCCIAPATTTRRRCRRWPSWRTWRCRRCC